MSEAGGAAAAALPRRRSGGMRAAWGSVWCLCLAAAVGGMPAARRGGGKAAAARSGGQPAGKGCAAAHTRARRGRGWGRLQPGSSLESPSLGERSRADGWRPRRELRTRRRGGSTSPWLGVVSEALSRDKVLLRGSLSGRDLPARRCTGQPVVTAGKMLACVCSGACSAHIGNALTACVRLGKVGRGHLHPHLGSKSGVASAPGRHRPGCS